MPVYTHSHIRIMLEDMYPHMDLAYYLPGSGQHSSACRTTADHADSDRLCQWHGMKAVNTLKGTIAQLT